MNSCAFPLEVRLDLYFVAAQCGDLYGTLQHKQL